LRVVVQAPVPLPGSDARTFKTIERSEDNVKDALLSRSALMIVRYSRALVVLASVSRAIAAQSAQPYDLQRLDSGVYAVVRHDPISYVNNGNSLVVVGDSGVLVVDAQFTRLATNQTIGAIRQITSKPVRYVVNTHWHDDHVAGNQVYRDSFPGVRFIAHANTRADLIALGAPNRRGTWDAAGPFTSRFERLLGQGLGIDSTPVVPLERATIENTIVVGRQYLAEKNGFRETLPDFTFTRALSVDLGGRRIDIRYFGEANTRGDAVVIIPDSRIIATGDILVAPVPFAFSAYISGWVGALDSISARKPATLLPGHGPVMHDETYLRLVRRMLARVRDETHRAVASGADLAEARKRVLLTDERAKIAHGDKWLNFIFESFFLAPAIGRAFEEASAGRTAP
jgi:glyoxylase-like metal-dependent hydrolase (beta-lactamase superfamily II)